MLTSFDVTNLYINVPKVVIVNKLNDNLTEPFLRTYYPNHSSPKTKLIQI